MSGTLLLTAPPPQCENSLNTLVTNRNLTPVQTGQTHSTLINTPGNSNIATRAQVTINTTWCGPLHFPADEIESVTTQKSFSFLVDHTPDPNKTVQTNIQNYMTRSQIEQTT